MLILLYFLVSTWVRVRTYLCVQFLCSCKTTCSIQYCVQLKGSLDLRYAFCCPYSIFSCFTATLKQSSTVQLNVGESSTVAARFTDCRSRRLIVAKFPPLNMGRDLDVTLWRLLLLSPNGRGIALPAYYEVLLHMEADP
jgi:hypothetical protein